MSNFGNTAFIKKLILIIFVNIFLCQHIISQDVNIDSLEYILQDLSGKEKAEMLNSFAGNLLRISPNKSVIYAKRAIDLAKAHNLKDQEAHGNTLLGDAYYYLGDFDNAIINYKKSLKIYDQNTDSTLIADIFSNIGLSYFNVSLLDTSLYYYYKALQIYKNNNVKNREAVLLMNFGNLFLTKMDYINAIDYYQSSLSVSEQQGNTQYTYQLLHNIGLVYMDWGYNNKALSYLEKAMKLSHSKGDKLSEATAASNIALINILENDLGQAIKNLTIAHEIYKKTDKKIGLCTIDNGFGNTFLKKKDYKKAQEYFFRSLQLAKTTDWKEGFIINNLDLGKLFFETKKLDRSLEYYKKGLALADTLGIQEYIIKGNLGISDVYFALSNPSKAYLHFKKYSKLKDSVFTMKTHGQITEIQTKYEIAKKEKENELLIHEKNLKEVELEKERTLVRVGVLFIILLFVTGFLAILSIKLKQKSITNELKWKNHEIEKRLLRSQMNPHFIFNSLNSIQSLISGNKPDLADIYLIKFARLLRSILMNTQKPYILLEEEIEFTELYLEIEQLRFEDSFEYDVIVEDDISPDTTYIPTMLIQPFIENALVHGLINKVKNAKLRVSFKKKNNFIQCTITDNGIGREKAGEIKSKYGDKAMGIRLTKDRLKLLNKQSNSEIIFKIIDLKDKSGKAQGTTVILNLPKEDYPDYDSR